MVTYNWNQTAIFKKSPFIACIMHRNFKICIYLFILGITVGPLDHKCKPWLFVVNTINMNFRNVFMLLMPNPDPTIWMSQQKWKLTRPRNIFPVLNFPFWWAWVNCSLSFLSFNDRSGNQCGLLLPYSNTSASSFSMFFVERCSSATLELLMLSYLSMVWPCVHV